MSGSGSQGSVVYGLPPISSDDLSSFGSGSPDSQQSVVPSSTMSRNASVASDCQDTHAVVESPQSVVPHGHSLSTSHVQQLSDRLIGSLVSQSVDEDHDVCLESIYTSLRQIVYDHVDQEFSPLLDCESSDGWKMKSTFLVRSISHVLQWTCFRDLFLRRVCDS